MHKIQMVEVNFTRLITTRYRVTEFAAKVADRGLVGRGVMRMKGTFHCDGQHLMVTVTKNKPHLTRIKVLGQDSLLQHAQKIIFIGTRLNEVDLSEEVQHHLLTTQSIVNGGGVNGEIVYDLKKRRAHIAVDSLQEQDVDDISTSQHHRSLPSGWYCDGISYVNTQQGLYKTLRPDIEELKEEYVTSYNLAVDKHNLEVDRLSAP